MDKFKLKEIIDARDDEYNSLYEKINVIDKHQTDFNQTYYNEIIYLSLFLFHIKKGIDKLSKNGTIPNLISRVDSYESFKHELEKYKDIEFHNDLLPNETNLFQEIWRLASSKLLSRDFSWTKIYSSSIYGKEVKEDGKIYISVDNKDLYQFACLMLTNCLKSGIKDFEFKVNNDNSINRTDNMVIYFTYENLNKYLEIIEKLKVEYPEMLINQCHILGEELSDGVVIAKDYADGSSFTEKICRTILKLKESCIPSEKIVDMINDAVTEHLNQVISQTENKSTNKKV